MYANYHTHTCRCHHAQGQTKEYVENAVKAGIKILGFSDHVPYPFHNGYVSHIRMSPEETQGYVEELHALQEEYRGQIQILIGYEAEYYPDEFEGMLKHIGQYGYDYLILGQHFLKNEYDGYYAGGATDQKALLEYTDQVIEGLQTGKFLYLAHPDLVPYRENEKEYRKQAYRLCEEAKKQNVPLEINIMGIRENRRYPYELFWQIAGEVGNTAVIGLDAHNPKWMQDTDSEEKALALVKRFGLELKRELKIEKKAKISI